MKVKSEVSIEELEKVGFSQITKEYCEDNWIDDEDPRYYYKFGAEVAEGRRGQCYWLLLDETRTIHIYATNPDGTGAVGKMDGLLLEMFKAGMIE